MPSAFPSDPEAPPTTTAPQQVPGSWFGRASSHPSARLSDAHADDIGLPGSSNDSGLPPTAKNLGRRADDRNRNTFFRTYRAFLTARAALALVLISLLLGSWLLGNRPSLWLMTLTGAYVGMALAWWGWPGQRQLRDPQQHALRRSQALATIGVDLGAFALLHYLTGSSINSQALLILPVLMAAVLLPRIMALGVAAAATLNLLAAAWIQSGDMSGVTSLLTQAGLTGFGLFAVAVLASELAGRLAREERSARGSMELARQQAQLNRLVIEEMTEGVLVVDRKGGVRAANPAARRLLSAQGLTPPPPFQLRGVPAWQPMIRAVEQAVGNPLQAEDGQEVNLRFDDQSLRALRVRVRFTRGQEGQALEDMCVMLLEDLRTVRARQRQDKLAAMGRMSAGIAHEVRNPLAAIAQANALMAEDANTPTQKKLTQLVSDNVARLKHIIDDILAVAPGLRPPAPAIDAIETIVAICNDWRSTQGLASGPDSLLEIDTSGCHRAPGYPGLKIRFEPDHLQRVLVNLLDNALRYNTDQPGAILVSLRWVPSAHAAGLLMLSVFNDGEPVTADTERSLFEPFFSTRSRGTGLGLYICRELCERHGASIDYRLHPPPVRHRNEFFVTMPVDLPGTPAYNA